MVCGTLARIGNEVYELQRPEIGELREPTTRDTVGSITMPHKRNPEGSEHLDTLARLVRANAGGAARGHGRGARAGRARLEGRVGRAARGVPADRRRAASWPGACSPAWSSTSTRCGPTSTRHGDQLASEQVLAGLTPAAGQARRPAAAARDARARAGATSHDGRRRARRAGRCGQADAAARGVARPGGGGRRRDGRRRRRTGARRARCRARVAGHETPRASRWPRLPTPLRAGAAAWSGPSTPGRCSSSATT